MDVPARTIELASEAAAYIRAGGAMTGHVEIAMRKLTDELLEHCARLVHDRLGADGYGVAQMIRAKKFDQWERPSKMPGPQSEMSPGMVAPNQELIDAVVNAHALAMRMDEEGAIKILVLLGMEKGEADELLSDARLCACEDHDATV